MPRSMLSLRKDPKLMSWDGFVWAGWPSCQESPGFQFQQQHWTVLDSLPRLSLPVLDHKQQSTCYLPEIKLNIFGPWRHSICHYLVQEILLGLHTSYSLPITPANHWFLLHLLIEKKRKEGGMRAHRRPGKIKGKKKDKAITLKFVHSVLNRFFPQKEFWPSSIQPKCVEYLIFPLLD